MYRNLSPNSNGTLAANDCVIHLAAICIYTCFLVWSSSVILRSQVIVSTATYWYCFITHILGCVSGLLAAVLNESLNDPLANFVSLISNWHEPLFSHCIHSMSNVSSSRVPRFCFVGLTCFPALNKLYKLLWYCPMFVLHIHRTGWNRECPKVQTSFGDQRQWATSFAPGYYSVASSRFFQHHFLSSSYKLSLQNSPRFLSLLCTYVSCYTYSITMYDECAGAISFWINMSEPREYLLDPVFLVASFDNAGPLLLFSIR